MKKRLRICLLLTLFFPLTLPAFASSESIGIIRVHNDEYLPLDEILSRSGLEHSYDMISRKGRLYRENHYAVYGVGLSVLLVDGSLYKSSVTVHRRAGRVLIPIDAAEYILK